MFTFVAALATVLVLSPPAFAQDDYTVWSSVIVARTGERTPEVLGDLPVELTTLGAQQAYAAGAFFRNRYITLANSSNNGVAPIYGLASDTLNNLQLYVSTLDYQWTQASAQAFLQGLYPPVAENGSIPSTSNSDSTSELADGDYYAQIHTYDALDANFVYVSANLDCPAYDMAANEYYNTPEFKSLAAEYKGVYDALGSALLDGVIATQDLDYYNAYVIYDYLSYQNIHNSSFAFALSEYKDGATNTSYLDITQWLAGVQQYAMMGNLTAVNQVSKTVLPGGITGSISTIAGNMLASKVLGLFQGAIELAAEEFKLNLIVADYAPMVSFFALTELGALNDYFRYLPDFGSVAAFELFSYTNGSSNLDFPSDDDLRVRFYFRNGTDDDANYQSYSLVQDSPDELDMSWSSFESLMYGIALLDVGDWCLQCGASNLFCAAWNGSDGDAGSGSSASGSHTTLTPPIAGVIGAVVTLILGALGALAAVLCCGLQLHFEPRSRRRRSDLGGFKGGAKMASDQDLTLAKHAAVIGTAEQDGPMSPLGGHERAGSWELKPAPASGVAGGGGGDDGLQKETLASDAESVTRPSFETERGHDPFVQPVRPTETV